ncbi:hypothetical protein C9374_007481 [Naegleria lovaniensis]|uniref:Uncharacterized protein n=1 Tax=Naegleria lovaniensis TaxID=51637 RepID=A0AA88GH45_NAELO|nr:uncharacterized protein C9374_007481 [Naegleria lovaniensis]KAG2379342.1 hypothetical protein C9374_007481 [Naegleria lovaniensis]
MSSRKQTRFTNDDDTEEDPEKHVGFHDADFDKLSDRLSFMTGSTGKSSFNMNKFFINPVEQRELSMGRAKLKRYDERIATEIDKIQELKHQITQVTRVIADHHAQISYLQVDEEALKLEFIKAKLEYELECRKRQMHEKEIKHLRKIREAKENEFLRKGWRLQKEQAVLRKHESKTTDIVQQVNRIQNEVEDLEEDVHHYKSLDRKLKSTIQNQL